jgi:hypothetical protein
LPLPHMAQALKDIIAYLETGDKSHLQEAKKNLDNLEVLIKESQKKTETPSKKRQKRR